MVGLIDQNRLGARVRVGQDVGTIKYIGIVEGHEGTWIGVEWDDPSRGRHNGTVNGHYYFETKYPKSGSLIRSEKIEKFETLENAIRERYLPPEQQSYINDQLLNETRDALSAPFMKVIGMEKIRERQSKLKFIEELTISNSTINEAGKLPELDSLRSICLQSSCIATWKVVHDIASQIPSLRNIDLSYNRLLMINQVEPLKFETLDTLILNSCQLSNWDDVLNIARMIPNLREFALKQNNIKHITDKSSEVFQKLEVLILAENEICDFNEILKLSSVPSLRELLINNNEIKNVKLPHCDYTAKLTIFKNLESLNLRHNPIENELEMFNELDKLPTLNRLSYVNKKISNTPTTTNDTCENDNTEIFMQAIGMIENLTSFNRSCIEKIHRNDATYEMWKKFAPEWMKVGGEGDPKMEEFYQSHRCYPRLLKKYGNPDQFILQPQRKRVTTIEVQFKNVLNGNMYRKKVPLAMNVRSLVGLVYKIAALHTCPGMDLKSIKLYYIDAYNNNIKVYLDNSSKSLDYYSLQNGDTIYIEK
ncbi:hypothetical protein PVAND_003592 [Polypedilum vanderplanki]|uniref:Tubulin-specific chaperone E n=1 Tax=Polypedilum vanderplanki TaxID=319348 RepID=A0A9J6BV12_POLVA|nr:hypothetical protein PVAND_003592 [Polypedilum vanderplanki]